MKFSIYRFNPEVDKKPYMQDYELDLKETPAAMVLDALKLLKKQDETLSFRRSCGEGVCGSDGMNINGRNGLACVTPLAGIKEPVVLRPFPGMPVIRDLIVDLTNFYKQYEKTKPYLQNSQPAPGIERLQSPAERAKLDGLYECIMCGCCSSSCPSYWWNPEKFLGPAAALQAARFIEDSRDDATLERLAQLDDAYSVFRCRSIMNCVDVCPKNLNPTKAIADIRDKIIKDGV
ncbi:MAG TPA: succinate dehydrogenase iron-sulfur subunit [Gammaproteobacteria bacterium]|nr:succinate dehydrogenase iron-sulfur subunit [Gammaproteobacteria bacterium]HQY23223.1 succinate dehydrogenase iron-sulfur subunit [Gammaproteobacteria bacterium]HQZ87596.1 succinate dehydrogenase iron-sulfur subunit [Gammaproteobacteria bacterium]HRA42846.1 succinate dehydrogenase iron-sulfur subunit [Gammaproteobacteria bacterium]